MRCLMLGVSGAVCALAVGQSSRSFGTLVGIATVVFLGVLTLELLSPVISFAGTLRDRARLSQGVVVPVLRTLAIGFLTEIGKNICEDAGEKSVAGALELCGGAAALYVLLPLMQNLLDLMEALL